MAEEHRYQAPRLCANNCGFFGCPATQDLCSKCYRDLQLKEQQSSNAKLAFTQTLSSSASSSSAVSLSSPISLPTSAPISIPSAIVEEKTPVVPGEAKEAPAAAAAPQQQPSNRCSTCRRRVGLTGFKCRCEMTFCGAHRYPEQHACRFDYKSMGREQISKANPLIKAEKLEKI